MANRFARCMGATYQIHIVGGNEKRMAKEPLKNLDVGGFAVIPVSEPTGEGGYDGIHFYVFCLSSGFSRIGGK